MSTQKLIKAFSFTKNRRGTQLRVPITFKIITPYERLLPVGRGRRS